MTKDQILAQPAAEISTNAWLKEIAYQLATMNERGSVEMVEPLPAPVVEVVKQRRGRPPKVKKNV